MYLLIALALVEDEIWNAGHQTANLLQLLVDLRITSSLTTCCLRISRWHICHVGPESASSNQNSQVCERQGIPGLVYTSVRYAVGSATTARASSASKPAATAASTRTSGSLMYLACGSQTMPFPMCAMHARVPTAKQLTHLREVSLEQLHHQAVLCFRATCTSRSLFVITGLVPWQGPHGNCR